MKLDRAKASQTHRCIIFGAPKTGKTLLAGKLAEFYNLLWVDMENGHETLFQLPEEWQERIELIDLPDTRSFPIAIETCLKMIKGKPVSICDVHGKVGCMTCKREEKGTVDVELQALTHNDVVVFDSLTQLTNSAIAHITKSRSDDYNLSWDDWGNLGKLMDIFLSHIQQAGYNVIVISHETEAETEGKKKTLVPVGGTRNFSRNVAKYFDHVIYAERKNRKHIFASSSCYNNTILTGSRTDVALEDDTEAGLLAIFKPELFAANSSSSKPNPKPAATALTSGKSDAGKASDVLARLKARKT